MLPSVPNINAKLTILYKLLKNIKGRASLLDKEKSYYEKMENYALTNHV